MAAVERFDIEKVAQIFQDSLRDDDDVLMDEYLKAYEEIMKYKQFMYDLNFLCYISHSIDFLVYWVPYLVLSAVMCVQKLIFC